jgi:hypothetical protein
MYHMNFIFRSSFTLCCGLVTADYAESLSSSWVATLIDEAANGTATISAIADAQMGSTFPTDPDWSFGTHLAPRAI